MAARLRNVFLVCLGPMLTRLWHRCSGPRRGGGPGLRLFFLGKNGCWTPYFLIFYLDFIIWYLLISIDIYWYLLISIDIYWYLLISIDIYWYLLISIVSDGGWWKAEFWQDWMINWSMRRPKWVNGNCRAIPTTGHARSQSELATSTKPLRMEVRAVKGSTSWPMTDPCMLYIYIPYMDPMGWEFHGSFGCD